MVGRVREAGRFGLMPKVGPDTVIPPDTNESSSNFLMTFRKKISTGAR
jgi:hypothetical protein